MWALVEDNAITKIINNPKGLVIGDTRYSRNIFSFRWTNEEREAIGIYEVITDSSNRKDENWYINTNESYAFADNQVTRSWGTATPKLLEDRNETNEMETAIDNASDVDALATLYAYVNTGTEENPVYERPLGEFPTLEV